jgi:hypothetical protein
MPAVSLELNGRAILGRRQRPSHHSIGPALDNQ